MQITKGPAARGRSGPGTRRRWGAIAIGVVVAALAAAGCSSGSSSGSSGNGKVTITELDYFTSNGGIHGGELVQQEIRGGAPQHHGQA